MKIPLLAILLYQPSYLIITIQPGNDAFRLALGPLHRLADVDADPGRWQTDLGSGP